MNTKKTATAQSATAKKATVTTATAQKANKVKTVKQPSAYNTQVLKRWANLREEKGKIGYCLSFIKAQADILQLTSNEIKYINNWKKDASELNANLKANKAGKYSAWQIFQYLYKISK